ncbi:MAG: glycoside hydrolase 100 family protein [Candidatus Diapherotrites archaeon]
MKGGKLIEEAREKAIEVMDICSTPNGLYASGGKYGYASVWARDSMISLIGASAHTKKFRKVFAASLRTLAKHQSKNGQIPNCVDVFEKRDLVTFATLDSSLWFVIGNYFYKKRFGNDLWGRHKKNIEKAMQWTAFQDAGEDMLPEQLPTSDWMDCFPHRYGHCINTQALYYGAKKAGGNANDLKEYKKKVDYYLWDSGLEYFLPWHWKDHGPHYSEKEEWFDSLGNMLAIVFGLASPAQARKILGFVHRKRIDRPFPMKVIYPPIKKGSKEWQDYYKASLAGTPGDYLNGGIWPFVGGFYVAALVEAKKYAQAEEELERLAKANSLGHRFDWDFNEWIHPKTKKAEGSRHQAWSAGSYLLAYEAVKSRKNPLKL